MIGRQSQLDFGVEFGEEPTIVDSLPPPDQIHNGSLYIIKNYESRYLTHKIHKFAGKFIPELPRWAISHYLSGRPREYVVDPFVGSGTTLVEASLLGVSSIGLDVDPLARLIAKVKTTPISSRMLDDAVREILARLDRARGLAQPPAIATLAHWFRPDSVMDLVAIKGLVDEYRDHEDLHDFLIVCFSAIIRRASNADNAG